MGKLKNSVKVAKRALELESNFPKIQFRLAQALMDLSEFDEARRFIDEVTEKPEYLTDLEAEINERENEFRKHTVQY